MVENFFNPALQQAAIRVPVNQHKSRFLLDKNELSHDIDLALKMEVMHKLLEANWNRYPCADYKDIESSIANYCGLSQENIALGPGSANIITTLLNYFALNQKEIVITQPSYSLFDYHCKTYNIPYKPWLLTDDLEYDYANLPQLNENSVLIITSPNNPVGNSIEFETVENLLRNNPKSVVIVDGVYCEFSKTDFTPLVKKYDNLIVLRSFSKAFPVAGLRLGYLCAAPCMAALIKKLILQFSITPFSLAFARNILFKPSFLEASQKLVQQIISEREYMYLLIKENFNPEQLEVFKSEGNFLLLRVNNEHCFQKLMEELSQEGIKVLNTSAGPLLKNTFRLSIGSPAENEIVFQHLLRCRDKNRIFIDN
ncbi:MAG: aminotransferase class I/II-fold pyridoxal phosphate-dependent enzyme [Saprospiraceae bacterium]